MIYVQRENLYRALKAIKPVMKGSKYFPVLQYVQIVAESGNMRIEGTDIEMHVQVNVPAACSGGNSWFLFPFDKLWGLCLESSGDIEIDCQNGRWLFDSGSGKFHGDIIGADVSDYPVFVQAPFERLGTDVPIDRVRQDFDQVKHIKSDRFGVLLDGTYSRIYATDGHRINTVAARYLPQGKACIASRDVARALSVLKLFSGSLSFGYSDKIAQMGNDEFVISIRTQDNPPAEASFVGDMTTVETAWIPRSDVLKALKMTKIFCLNPHADLNIWLRPYQVTFRSGIADLGRCEHTVDCYVPESMAGKEFRVSHKYFSEAVRHLDGENVPLRVAGYLTIIGDEILAQKREE